MIHDQLIAKLEKNPKGLSTSALAEQLDLPSGSETLCALEAILTFCSEVGLEDQKWKIIKSGRKNKILNAIESYANFSGKKIFRLSAALSGLPINDYPTEEELREMFDAMNGQFQLLRNAMIKRNR